MLVTLSCLTPWDPGDCSPPDSSVHGIFQARILYRVAISSSKKKNDSLRLHGLYSPGSSPGQNTGVGSFVPSPADLPNLGIELGSPSLQADSRDQAQWFYTCLIFAGVVLFLMKCFLKMDSSTEHRTKCSCPPHGALWPQTR